jgi:hypothetical protein
MILIIKYGGWGNLGDGRMCDDGGRSIYQWGWGFPKGFPVGKGTRNFQKVQVEMDRWKKSS